GPSNGGDACMRSRRRPFVGARRDFIPIGSETNPIFTTPPADPLHMTIDRRGFLATSASAIALGKSGISFAALEPSAETPEPPDLGRIEAREITVYTTAENTEYLLSATDKLAFKPMGQPLETQVCVFVDPTKRAQTMVGIGGALPDPAAETFAKLPAAKQREILTAYFDRDKGIGYTLGRTHIHSCDFSSA